MHKNVLYAIIVVLVAICLIGIYGSAFAKETWEQHWVICNDSEDDIRKFIKDENLVPLVGGPGKILTGPQNNNHEPVVTYIFSDTENSVAVMRYHQNKICLVAVLAGVEWNPDKLKEYLGIK